jgi:hypothetical protein
MKLMKSGIELDAEKQEKIKGGHCVCYCDIGYMVHSAETYGVEGEYCACTCYTEAIADASDRMEEY